MITHNQNIPFFRICLKIIIFLAPVVITSTTHQPPGGVFPPQQNAAIPNIYSGPPQNQSGYPHPYPMAQPPPTGYVHFGFAFRKLEFIYFF